DLPRILAAVEANGLTLERILVTHGHIDHAGAVADLAERLSLPVEGPQQEDKFWIDGMPQQSKAYGFPNVRAFTPDRWLEHVVFFNAPGRLAFVGDVLFKGSICRTDFPKGDFDTLIASIQGRLWPLGDDVTFVSGHGALSTFGAERRSNPFCGD
ncbi:MAG: MBL fold metallo-hydrolase, partial [Deltaproteobacteria bacterium]|nr:MBL fold metallo-hydrolase [Deltaproteobacteria bacterium]